MLHFCLTVPIEGHLNCLRVPLFSDLLICPSATQVPLWSAQVSSGHPKSIPKWWSGQHKCPLIGPSVFGLTQVPSECSCDQPKCPLVGANVFWSTRAFAGRPKCPLVNWSDLWLAQMIPWSAYVSYGHPKHLMVSQNVTQVSSCWPKCLLVTTSVVFPPKCWMA